MEGTSRISLLALYGLMFLPFYNAIREEKTIAVVAIAIYLLYLGLHFIEKQNTIRPFLIVPTVIMAIIAYTTGVWAIFYPLALFPFILKRADNGLSSSYQQAITILVLIGAIICFVGADVINGSIMDKMFAYAPLIFTMAFTLIDIKSTNFSNISDFDKEEYEETIEGLKNQIQDLKIKLKNANEGLNEENYLAVVLGLDFEGFDYESNVKKTIDTIKNSTKAIFTAYYEFDKNDSVFKLKDTIGQTSSIITKKKIQPGIGIIGSVYNSQQYAYVRNLSEKEDIAGSIELLNGVDSILAIPIVVNGAVKAVVSVGLPKLSKKKEMDIINLCCIVANKVSLEFAKMEQHVATEKKSITDKLTGLYNRQFFDAKIKEELNNAKLENRKLAYVEIDLDFFKQMNDTHGHEFGDMVLKTAADIFKKNIRNSDYAFRQGGDEFSLLLLGVDSQKAYDIVKHIKIEYAKKVEELHLYAKKDGADVKSSFSIGVAVYPHPKVDNVKDLLNLADEAVYFVKEHGKNNIAIAK